MTAVMSVASQL